MTTALRTVTDIVQDIDTLTAAGPLAFPDLKVLEKAVKGHIDETRTGLLADFGEGLGEPDGKGGRILYGKMRVSEREKLTFNPEMALKTFPKLAEAQATVLDGPGLQAFFAEVLQGHEQDSLVFSALKHRMNSLVTFEPAVTETIIERAVEQDLLSASQVAKVYDVSTTKVLELVKGA